MVAILLIICSCRESVDQIDNLSYDSVLMNALVQEMHCTLISENEKINLGLQVLDIDTDSVVTLRELSENEKILFFFYSNFQCGECVDRELKFIKELYQDNTVIILAKENGKRNLAIVRKTKAIHQKMYLMNREDSLNMSMEDLSRPIFFRINKLGQPYNLYSPKFSYPQFSKLYHTIMAKQIGQNWPSGDIPLVR